MHAVLAINNRLVYSVCNPNRFDNYAALANI